MCSSCMLEVGALNSLLRIGRSSRRRAIVLQSRVIKGSRFKGSGFRGVSRLGCCPSSFPGPPYPWGTLFTEHALDANNRPSVGHSFAPRCFEARLEFGKFPCR